MATVELKRQVVSKASALVMGGDAAWEMESELCDDDGETSEYVMVERNSIHVVEFHDFAEAKAVAQGILDTIAELEVRA